jgi:hypothetical protein
MVKFTEKIADEDGEKPKAPRPAATINKWDGEDEEDDIKVGSFEKNS